MSSKESKTKSMNSTMKKKVGDKPPNESSVKDPSSCVDDNVKEAIALAKKALAKSKAVTPTTQIKSLKTKTKKETKSGNILSDLIPGYIAPMTLDSSSLDQYRQKKTSLLASRNEQRQRQPKQISTGSTSINFKTSRDLPSQGNKRNSSAMIDESIRRDLLVIQNRNYLDPKKFYKSSDIQLNHHTKDGELQEQFQRGTVIEGCMESIVTNRLSKKQRKQNLMEEMMSSVYDNKTDYVKKTYLNLQQERMDKAANTVYMYKRNKGRRRK